MLVLSLFGHAQMPFDLQGHRGARGLMPENTIPAMLEAIRLGATTLELDVVITADGEVVLSHEAYINADICLDPQGRSLSKSEAKKINIFELTYAELSTYDCGSKGHPKFPEQQKMPVHKPLLRDLFEVVERHLRENKLAPVHYNIEIKSEADGDGIWHPEVEVFAELVLQQVFKAGLASRVIIQSFDVRPLQYINRKNYPVRLALLNESPLGYQQAIKQLGFIPHIYSPYYKFLSKKLMTYAAQTGMQVIPWTINETDEMEKAIALGVHGIITDYPDRLNQLINK